MMSRAIFNFFNKIRAIYRIAEIYQILINFVHTLPVLKQLVRII